MKNKNLLLTFAALLVLLQVVLPFLHAHTGVSSISGFHLHFSTAPSVHPLTDVVAESAHESYAGEVAISNLKDRESDRPLLPLERSSVFIITFLFLAACCLPLIFRICTRPFDRPEKKRTSPNFYLLALAPPDNTL